MSLYELSLMVINGNIVSKMDHIATVYIDGRCYFNVFRRYNSDYNIIIEDYNKDIYIHQNYKVRESLNTILCTEDVHTISATSLIHNGPAPCAEIADMTWTEVHNRYQIVSVNFGDANSAIPEIPEISTLRNGKIYKN